ncbi:sushi, von Willebrand factor type A, EGF and pentraxin domain-containing protein 1-like [Mercenaria mercenaria]|uniref:sushi, von Willebrand factor type A, EGF and pentraxin domain-containing protein 1-like n=1 Tax=Mercenaria mercenaria TaxID=6596 RepID=UPI00234F5B90|nr:sushi, von Willebrand factor type A, EGF and pentraxin domain-containing protein 1-like [Mercenaria mercenaria]
MKNIGCGPASKILHGTITSKDKSSSGSSANVTCDPGYKANISTVTCKSSGEWESAKCSAIDCGSVPVIVLGKITLVDLNNATYGASANITCDTGYTANVSAVSCQSSGVWETAICKAIDCGPVPEISFGTTKLIDEFNTTYGASAYLTCDTGFETNVSNITCQSSGLWETAVCKAKDCGPVPVVPFGRVSLIDNGNTTYGASANVTCETGFETSDLKIKCQSSGIWQTVICKSIDCGPVPAIAFGTTKLIDENNTTYGASAYLTCDTGFETNILNITCQSSGLWETAVCKAKDCGPVPEIAFGTTTLIDDNNTTYGASAYLTCDTGFETNVSNVMCQNSGLWETAVCKAKSNLNCFRFHLLN